MPLTLEQHERKLHDPALWEQLPVTHTGIANLVKKLREDMEEQEKSAPKLDGISKAGSANPQN